MEHAIAYIVVVLVKSFTTARSCASQHIGFRMIFATTGLSGSENSRIPDMLSPSNADHFVRDPGII